MKFNPNKLIKLKIKHIIILINNDLWEGQEWFLRLC